MLTLFIFCGAIALVFAVVTGVGSLVITFDPGAAAASSVGVFFVTFFAAVLLGLNDHWKQWQARRAVRKWLLARADMPDAEFLAAFPESTREIAQLARRFIAALFRVPEQKLRPGDQLNRDYDFDRLGGVVQTSLFVFDELKIKLQPGDLIAENIDALRNVRDLVAEIERLVQSKSRGNEEISDGDDG